VPVYPAIADRALFVPEHFLYLPLVGLAPLVVATVARLCPPRAAGAVLVAVLAVWGVLVVDRNRDWRDEETLFRHTIAYDPPAARAWYNLANLALAAGRLDEARRLYGEALVREPRDAAAHLNLGITLQRQNDRPAAEREYRAAIAADPAARARSRRRAPRRARWRPPRRRGLGRAVQALR
jgi:tetratricopeptide (TPR) repeat protein